MAKGKPYPIKALMTGGNPLCQWPGQEKLRGALDNLEVSVYYGIFPSEEALYFDYLLPTSPWVESGGLAPVSDERRVVFNPKLVPEAHNTKTERWLFIELGKRMGWGDIFKDEYNDPIVLQKAMSKKTGFSPERFLAKKDNSLRGPLPSPNAPEVGTLYLDGTKFPGKKGQFATKSGKIEIWTEALEKKFNVYGLSALPEFYADPEIGKHAGLPYLEYLHTDADKGVPSPFQKNKTWAPKVKIVYPEKAESNGYDIYLTTGRPKAAHFGNGTHWVWNLHEQDPVQLCHLHPKKAEELGIKDGDIVRVETKTGWTTAKAFVTEGIREDTVFIPNTFSTVQPWDPWKSVNYLTDNTQRCPISAQTNYKAYMCRIKKV
jgi:anaerobic selenocysteine-containing dehydrogenase